MGETLCSRCAEVVQAIKHEHPNPAARKLESLLTEVSGASVAEHRLLMVMADVLRQLINPQIGHDTTVMLLRLQDAMNPLLPEGERR